MAVVAHETPSHPHKKHKNYFAVITFSISLLLLILGYVFYGRFVERVFGCDASHPTPVTLKADGVDYIALPGWKVFMIQFLNIAGTGPIFGAIMGAKFGAAAYLWIVLGCIFAGAVHDFLSAMLSLRNGGMGLPELIGKYLGGKTRSLMLVFTVLLLIMVGAVFVYSPALLLEKFGGDVTMWFAIIFAYYILATMLPIDKIIGKIYPLFAFSLLFMAVALMVCLFVKMPAIPEIWDGLSNRALTVVPDWKQDLFPCLFITIACGAISGFHATQSPLMARCLKSEGNARRIFYGAMITEGMVALVWATIAMYFFYGEPTPGHESFPGFGNKGFSTAAPTVVSLVCNHWLGWFGGLLAILGVVAAPITSGDTALRSARLIIAEAFRVPQQKIRHRFLISIPIFAATLGLLLWQVGNPEGFNVIWQYFGWSNQTLSVFTLWMLTVYLTLKHKPYVITLVPAVFMTSVCTTYLVVSPEALNLPAGIGYATAACAAAVSLLFFHIWKKDVREREAERDAEKSA